MKVSNANEIAKVLEAERSKQGVSKNILAKKAGISRPTVLNIIKKGTVRNSYDVRNLIAVINALDLEISIS